MSFSGDLIAKLATLYPRAFFPAGKDRRPLKVGIDRDLRAAETGLSDRERAIAFSYYCCAFGYLKNMRQGAARIDLNGEAADTITAEEEQHAVKTIEGLRKKARATHQAPPSPEPAPSPTPKRLGLAGLKAAALARRAREEVS